MSVRRGFHRVWRGTYAYPRCRASARLSICPQTPTSYHCITAPPDSRCHRKVSRVYVKLLDTREARATYVYVEPAIERNRKNTTCEGYGVPPDTHPRQYMWVVVCVMELSVDFFLVRRSQDEKHENWVWHGETKKPLTRPRLFSSFGTQARSVCV